MLEDLGWKAASGRRLTSTRFVDGAGCAIELEVILPHLGQLHYLEPNTPSPHLRGKAASDAYHNRGNGVTAFPRERRISTPDGEDLTALLNHANACCREQVAKHLWTEQE